jgi:hypothetical protein
MPDPNVNRYGLETRTAPVSHGIIGWLKDIYTAIVSNGSGGSALLASVGATTDVMIQDGDVNGTLIAHTKGINEAANSTSPVNTYQVGFSANGVNNQRVLSAATINATVLKNQAGTLYGIVGYNSDVATLYVKVYDLATTPDPSAGSIPVAVFGVPTASNFPDTAFPKMGISCVAGIGFVLVKGFADTDETAVDANEVSLTFMYT